MRLPHPDQRLFFISPPGPGQVQLSSERLYASGSASVRWKNRSTGNEMIRARIPAPAISKHMPRRRPFPKGGSGNPRGRLKRDPEEVQLIEACREKTPEALETLRASHLYRRVKPLQRTNR